MSRHRLSYPHSRFTYVIIGLCCLLVIPFVAQQFTSEIRWSLGDFILAGLLLFLLGFFLDLISYNTQLNKLWLLLPIVVFVLIWAELAVGIFS